MPGLERDPRPVDANAAAASSGRRSRRGRRVRGHCVERAVVAGGDDSVMDGWVESSAGCLAGIERELDDPNEIPARVVDDSVAVEPRELGIVAEARHHLLEPLELFLGPVERAVCALAGLCVEQQLHVRAHRPEGSPKHHDVRVTVSGGRLTTRTLGAAAYWKPTMSRSTAPPAAIGPEQRRPVP